MTLQQSANHSMGIMFTQVSDATAINKAADDDVSNTTTANKYNSLLIGCGGALFLFPHMTTAPVRCCGNIWITTHYGAAGTQVGTRIETRFDCGFECL